MTKQNIKPKNETPPLTRSDGIPFILEGYHETRLLEAYPRTGKLGLRLGFSTTVNADPVFGGGSVFDPKFFTVIRVVVQLGRTLVLLHMKLVKIVGDFTASCCGLGFGARPSTVADQTTFVVAGGRGVMVFPVMTGCGSGFGVGARAVGAGVGGKTSLTAGGSLGSGHGVVMTGGGGGFGVGIRTGSTGMNGSTLGFAGGSLSNGGLVGVTLSRYPTIDIGFATPYTGMDSMTTLRTGGGYLGILVAMTQLLNGFRIAVTAGASEYLNSLLSAGGFFCYLSSIVVGMIFHYFTQRLGFLGSTFGAGAFCGACCGGGGLLDRHPASPVMPGCGGSAVRIAVTTSADMPRIAVFRAGGSGDIGGVAVRMGIRRSGFRRFGRAGGRLGVRSRGGGSFLAGLGGFRGRLRGGFCSRFATLGGRNYRRISRSSCGSLGGHSFPSFPITLHETQ